MATAHPSSAAVPPSRQPAPLPPAVPGDRRETTGRAGRLGFYVHGSGWPLLLIHSINAAASAYEVRPLFEALIPDRRVYALDLPGFGTSERSERPYTVRLFTDAIHDMADLIRGETGGGPMDALALSLSSEFLARAAAERPEVFRTLALVTPTGFSRGSHKLRKPPGTTREVPGLYPVFAFKPWSQGLYDLLTSRGSIRYFLGRTWGSKDIDDGMAEYDVLTARQPGARFAPLAFLSGRLFSRDIRTVYEQLTMPVWLAHGTKGDFRDFTDADWTRSRPTWRVTAYATGALPHFQVLEAFMRDYRQFLANPPGDLHRKDQSEAA